ncbi:MAG: complex I subunit 1/NuoH family protein, partial [Halobacteriota archaeon]
MTAALMQAATWTETTSEWLGVEPGPVGTFLLALVGAAFWGTVVLTLVGVNAAWFKRKFNARLGDRVAVNRYGPAGVFIIFADFVKLMSKEIVVPDGVDPLPYKLAPMVGVVAVVSGFAIVPWGAGLQLADPEVGMILAFAFTSLLALPIVMAGYSSNNKYSFIGFEREVAQTIAYEIPLVVAAVAIVPLVAVFAGTESPLRMSEIVAAQQGSLWGFDWMPLPNWFVFAQPFAAALFFVAVLAEFSRN